MELARVGGVPLHDPMLAASAVSICRGGVWCLVLGVCDPAVARLPEPCGMVTLGSWPPSFVVGVAEGASCELPESGGFLIVETIFGKVVT